MKFMNLVLAAILVFSLSSCGGDAPKKEGATPAPKSMIKQKKEVKKEEKKEASSMSDIGVGPITEAIKLGELDNALVAEGKKIYDTKCVACHKIGEKFIGPSQSDILQRRTPTWVMNMILAPEKMIKEDPVAMKLLEEFNGVPMTNQNLSEKEARAVLEYFRTI